MMVSVGYDSARRTLEIEFVSGDVYHYFEVGEDVHQALLAATSKGHFFHARIDGLFRYRRVRAFRNR